MERASQIKIATVSYVTGTKHDFNSDGTDAVSQTLHDHPVTKKISEACADSRSTMKEAAENATETGNKMAGQVAQSYARTGETVTDQVNELKGKGGKILESAVEASEKTVQGDENVGNVQNNITQASQGMFRFNLCKGD